MKKIGLYLLGAAVLFTSCESILNGDPDDSFTKGNYFTSDKNVELFANEMYNEFGGYDGAASVASNQLVNEGNYYYTFLSDDQASTGTENWYYKATPATSSVWDNSYTRIRRANTIIEQVPGIAALTEAQANNWLGVARMMRAFEHYKLVRCFGDIYFVDHVLDPGMDAAILYGKRHARNDVMDKVLEDIDFAIANIAAEKSGTAWSKDLARAMKAEICLYEAGYQKYTAKDAARANKFYGEVKAACEGIFANGYALGDYKKLFSSDDLAESTEAIFYKKYVWDVLGHSLVDFTCGSTQTHGMTKSAFDAYLGIDGKPITGNDQGVVENFTAADGHVGEDHAVINISACLALRDPRLSAAIDPYLFFPGCGYARFGGAEATSSTGYGIALYDDARLATEAYGGNSRRQSINGNDTDAPIYWLALEYLNYAEACAELGDDATAKTYIDKLRDRAGMPSVDVTLAAAGTKVIDEVRRERRVEMMFAKNDRYWSLIRWNQLDLLDTQKNPDCNRGAYVGNILPADVLAQVQVDADGYINCGGAGRTYEAKHLLFPIPSGQITLNPEVGQNPGW